MNLSSQSRRGRRVLTLVSGVAAACLLAACDLPVLEVEDGPSLPQPQSAQSGPQSGDEVALTDDQVHRIVAEVQAVLDTADADGSASGLAERLVDPALSMRTGQLVRADKTGTELAALIIGDDVHSATAGRFFPRVLVVASQAKGESPSEIYFLTQADAKAPYMLQNWVRLTGGTPVRGIAVRDGSTVLPQDYSGLLMSPKDALETYVNSLNSPKNEEYQVFTDNGFAQRYAEELSALNSAVQVAGNVTSVAATGDAPITSVMLDTGEALVAGSFDYVHTYKKTVEGATMNLGGTPAAYVSDTAIKDSVEVKYQVNIFFVVPPKGDDAKIAVVGAERVILSVK